MAVRIYGIKNCDTMKKAFAWLESHRIAYDFHDYKKAGVPSGKLKEWAAKAGCGVATAHRLHRLPGLRIPGRRQRRDLLQLRPA